MATQAEEDLHAVLTPITNKKITIYSSQTMVEMSTQTLLPTAKYHFLKCFDWVNSLIYREFTENVPVGDRLLILGQERLNELLVEADKLNEQDDYLDDPQFTAEEARDCQELLSQSVYLHYKRSRRLYTQIECEYHSQILKKKLKDGEGLVDQQLYEIFFLGVKTLGALMTLLMLRPQWRRLE